MKNNYLPPKEIFPLLILPGIIMLAFSAGCYKQNPEPQTDNKITKEINYGPVDLSMIIEPDSVKLDQDVLITIKAVTPKSVSIVFPALAEHTFGFTYNGYFDAEPKHKNNKIIRKRYYRLTPDIKKEYRINALPIIFYDKNDKQQENWFPTPPITLYRDKSRANITNFADTGIKPPIMISPSAATIVFWLLAAVILIIIILIAIKTVKRITRKIKIRSMSPRQRALFELHELEKKDLISKQFIKQFYLELTMIVRRYIEQAHGIRAPEQTTEEFLQASANSGLFKSDVLRKLKEFLYQADLVKFAAFKPDAQTVNLSLSTAKDYITSDEQYMSENEE
jgi:hypothetical protein